MNTKYIWLLVILLGFTACNEIEDVLEDNNVLPAAELPALTAGSANFSTYVSIGNSLTSGFTDNALFIAAQENSFPNMLSQKFAMVGGGTFTQPLMNDNIGGIALGGTRILEPRLVFGGAGPVPLESIIGPVTVTTDLVVNNPTGPFNNMGVPGAASFHLLAPGYGNAMNLPSAANPYFVRMTGATPNATMLEMALAQSPTFVSLWIGNNDVLGYATGGASAGAPTPQPMFNGSIDAITGALQNANVQGVMANIPYLTSLAYFTTVGHNVIPLDAGTAGAVNGAYAPYNAGIQQAFAFLVANTPMTQEQADAEIALRTIMFEAAPNNAVVIMDEGLTDLTAINPQLVSMRQANADDLLILPSSTFIGTEAVPGNPLSVNGVAIPLADNWVLVPSEQDEIKTAIDNFNAKLQSVASSLGFAYVDANALLTQLATGGIMSNDYTLNANLVTGGVFSLDGVHLTARGYALTANEMMKAIDVTYGSNFEASGNLLDLGDYPTNYHPTLQ